jgi:hypothetical protein
MGRPFSSEVLNELRDAQDPATATLTPETSPIDGPAQVAAEAVVRGHAEAMATLGTALHDAPRLCATFAMR